MHVLTRRALIGSGCLAAALAVTTAAGLRPPAPLERGLQGRYFDNPDWTGAPLLERLDRTIDSELLAATPEIAGRDRFSVEWTGYLVIRTSQIYRFATKSDDGSLLWIGDTLVVDNGGAHAVANVAGDIHLERGVYPIRIRYSQHGADMFLQLGQSLTGGMLHPAPLVPHPVTYDAFRMRELWSSSLVAVWYGAIAALGWAMWPWLRQTVLARELKPSATDRGFQIVALCGLALAAAHVTYGLPAPQVYAPDELDALDTLTGSRDGFRTWNLRWPPLHAFMVAGLLQPFAWAAALFHLPLEDEAVSGAMTLIMRGLSVAQLGATLLLTFDATRLLFDRRAAIAAAALLATSPVVVFFGSLANLEVPHLFWVALTFWIWVKLCLDRATLWYGALGVATGLSLAAKDQAYAYWLAAPVALLLLVRGNPRGAGPSPAAVRHLVYVGVGGLIALALGHGLPWRMDRFVQRWPEVMGPASVAYRMFPATPEGQVRLLGATMKSLTWAAGAPLTIAFAGGIATLLGGRQARLLLLIVTPILTYYVGFLAVIGYVYDRFLIGWLPILSSIGGVFVARLLAGARPLRIAVAGAILLAAALNAVAVNVVFHGDPKDEARRWLASNLACGTSVGIAFDRRFVPPLPCYDVWIRRPGEAMQLAHNTDILVFNEAYIQRFGSRAAGREFLAGLQSGALGFERIRRFDTRPPPWAPLYWESRFWNRREDPETTADKPLHAIEIWRRTTPRPAA